ncbi:MAG: hypothetical protein U0793_17750 [Gemmataceae bacterium]
MRANPRVIGVDFDNTIACYDDLLCQLALERGLVRADAARGKKAIRDHIRTLPDGENEWQRLQAIMYGPAIEGARPFEGVLDFLRSCRARGMVVQIVSHKTSHSNLLRGGADFREAATRWMAGRGFFDASGIGLTPAQVHYESTREEKVARLQSLRCGYFIDDLEETFGEKTFPVDVKKVLFNPHGEPVRVAGVHACSSWRQIKELVVDGGARRS